MGHCEGVEGRCRRKGGTDGVLKYGQDFPPTVQEEYRDSTIHVIALMKSLAIIREIPNSSSPHLNS